MTERNFLDQAQALEALRQAMMRSWWWICLGLWLSVGALSLWSLRGDLQELHEYFTWAAMRYMLVYGRLAAVGLGLCVGLTVALLIAESRHILWGLSGEERSHLLTRLNKINEQGPSHPHWTLIHSANATSTDSQSEE